MSERRSFLMVRWLFLRGLGGVYLLAFGSLWVQIDALVGPGGILPADELMQRAHQAIGADAYRVLPGLFWLLPDGFAPSHVCLAGLLLSLLLIAGIGTRVVLAAIWIAYLSIVSVGQDFLSFQWDALLLETGFVALLIAPGTARTGLAPASPPPTAGIWALRWLLFKLMFMSGVVKLTSGDEAWWGLTALEVHHETQPLPTWVGWFFHQLPAWSHRLSAAIMFGIELILPFLVFGPRRVRLIPFAGFALLLVLIALSGNYGFFNLLALLLLIPLLDDGLLRGALPARLARRLPDAPALPSSRRPWLSTAVAAGTVVLGIFLMVSRFAGHERLPAPARGVIDAVRPFHAVNGYGLFAVMTRQRPEIVLEGSEDGRIWKEYPSRYKPGDPARRPRFVAPHMPRLDWQLWFAALSGDPRASPWFSRLALRILEGSPEVTALLGENPFPHRPPRHLRARLYLYRFTDGGEPGWWHRTPVRLFLPPVSLRGR